VGVVPQVDDYYPDGKVRTRIRRRGTGQRATSFGGCLLIDRDALVAIGGWRYSLDSSEDLDLMARLSCNGLGVAYNEDTYVIHHTRKASILDELGDYYLPTRPRFGSIGRALVAQDGFAAVLSILKIHREALLFPAALLIFLLHPCLGLFALAGAEFDLLRRRSVKYNVVIPGAFLSIFFGVFQSDRRKDEPRYAMVG
jgi:GT2 family glycosyltransferase